MKKDSVKHPKMGNLKWCFVCQQYRDVSEFHPTYKNSCCSCSGAYEKESQHRYYLEHRDELLPKHRISALESIKRRKLNA